MGYGFLGFILLRCIIVTFAIFPCIVLYHIIVTQLMDTGLNGMSGSSVMLHVPVEYSSEQETVWNLYMEVWTVLVMILSHRYVTKTHVLVSVFHVYDSATGYVSLWSTSKRLIGVWWDGWCKCIVKYTHLYANCKGLLKNVGRITNSIIFLYLIQD